MHTFTSIDGQEYHLKMTIGSAKAYKNKLDLIDGEPANIIEVMASDMTMRLDMLWHFLDNKDSVDDRDAFENSLSGDVLLHADEALWGELAFFIQSLRPHMKEVMTVLLSKYKEMTTRQSEIVLKLAKKLDLEGAEAMIEKEAVRAMEERQKQILEQFTK